MDLSTPISATTDLGFFDPSTRRASIEERATAIGVTLDPDRLTDNLVFTDVLVGDRPETVAELVEAIGRALAAAAMQSVLENTPPEEA